MYQVIRKSTKKNSQTAISTHIFSDSSLDFESLGLLSYILSKPYGWELTTEKIMKDRDMSRKQVLRILKKLRKAGYVRLRRYKNNRGFFEFTEYDYSDHPEFL